MRSNWLMRACCEKRQQSAVFFGNQTQESSFKPNWRPRPSIHLTTGLQPAACSYLQTGKGPTGLAVDRVWRFWSLEKCGPSRKGKCFHMGLAILCVHSACMYLGQVPGKAGALLGQGITLLNPQRGGQEGSHHPPTCPDCLSLTEQLAPVVAPAIACA